MDRRFLLYAVTLCAAAGIITVLSLEVRRLRPYEREARQSRVFPTPGSWLPDLAVQTMNGDTAPLLRRDSAAVKVIFFFTTTCPFCLESLPTWKASSLEMKKRYGERVAITWVSGSPMAATSAYAKAQGVQEPVVRILSGRDRMVARFSATPLVIVADSIGRVRAMRPSRMVTRAAMDSLLQHVAQTLEVTNQNTVANKP